MLSVLNFLKSIVNTSTCYYWALLQSWGKVLLRIAANLDHTVFLFESWLLALALAVILAYCWLFETRQAANSARLGFAFIECSWTAVLLDCSTCATLWSTLGCIGLFLVVAKWQILTFRSLLWADFRLFFSSKYFYLFFSWAYAHHHALRV